MERTISASEAGRTFDTVLGDIVAGGDHYVVELHGQAVAAVVPIDLYQQWKSARDAFFDRLEGSAWHADMSEDETMELALEAQRAARAERRRVSA